MTTREEYIAAQNELARISYTLNEIWNLFCLKKPRPSVKIIDSFVINLPRLQLAIEEQSAQELGEKNVVMMRGPSSVEASQNAVVDNVGGSNENER